MSRKGVAARLQPGERLASHLTVVGAIDTGGRDPVAIVWNHAAWCVMCCKVFRKKRQVEWEARALRRLAHPGIVRLLENGVRSGHGRYLLTEFLEGPTLRGLIRSRPAGRLAASDALRVAIHLGAALSHMHGRGLLHLDVKTTNVIVTRRRPVLFDLGSARRLDGWKLRSPQGTDAYMAPEQARAQVPGPASDVWGLAVVLFEMLTGVRPFPKGDDAAPFPQLHQEAAALRRHLPRAPAALDGLIARCLSTAPEARPPLAQLLPELNAMIRSGPRMWPPGLDPTVE